MTVVLWEWDFMSLLCYTPQMLNYYVHINWYEQTYGNMTN